MFDKVECYICKRVLFRVDLKTCHFVFYFFDFVETLIVLSDFFRVYFIIWDGFSNRIGFSNRKTEFLDILCFLCQLCNEKGCLFQCVVSNFYHRDHKLIVKCAPWNGYLSSNFI